MSQAERCPKCGGPVERVEPQLVPGAVALHLSRIRARPDTLEDVRQEWKWGDGGTELRIIDRLFNGCDECGRYPMAQMQEVWDAAEREWQRGFTDATDAAAITLQDGKRQAFQQAAEMLQARATEYRTMKEASFNERHDDEGKAYELSQELCLELASDLRKLAEGK